MKLAIASDHAGFVLKNHLRGVLESLGHADLTVPLDVIRQPMLKP